MPGANYMGGTINAAKARAKDSESRASKRHFGKQRLAILSKGLGRSTDKPTARPRARDTALERIDLAHAQQNRRTVSEDQRNPSKIPVVHAYIHKSPASSPLAKRRRLNSGSSPRSHLSGESSYTSTRSSRVLRELDRSNPLCASAARAHLLSLPDFAGLSLPKPVEFLDSSSSPSSVQHNRPSEDREISSPSRSQGSILSFSSPSYSPTHPQAALTSDPSSWHGIKRDSSEGPAANDDVATGIFFFRPPDRPSTPEFASPNPSYASSQATAVSSSLALHAPIPVTPGMSGSTAWSEALTRSAVRLSDFSSPAHTHTRELHVHDSRQSAHRFAFYGSPPSSDYGSARSPLRFNQPSFAHLTRLSPESQDIAYIDDANELESIHFARSWSRSSSPVESTVQETLLDAVHGNLFENSDPWTSVKGRLDLVPLDLDELDPGDAFRDLLLTQDRSGVGYVPIDGSPQQHTDLAECTPVFAPGTPDRAIIVQPVEPQSPCSSAPYSATSSCVHMEAPDEPLPPPVHCATRNEDRFVERRESDALPVEPDAHQEEVCAHRDEEVEPTLPALSEVIPVDASLENTADICTHVRPGGTLEAGPNVRIAGPTLFFGDGADTDEEE